MRSTAREARQAVVPALAGSRPARVLLVVLIAVASGAWAATTAAARRTSTAYDRLVEFSDPPDVVMGGGASDEVDRLPEALARSEVVERFAVSSLIAASIRTPDGVLQPFERLFAIGSTLADGPTKVVDGRLPSAPTEAVIPAITADRVGLGVGDQLTLVTPEAVESGPPELAIDVVGVVAVPGQFPSIGGRVLDAALLGSAFARAHPEWIAPEQESSYDVWLVDGAESLPDFREEGDRLGFTSIDVDEQSEVARGVNRITRVEAGAILIAGALAAFAGFVVVVQLLRRHCDAATSSLSVLRSIGVTRSGLLAGGALFGARLGVVGGAIGAVGAAGTSAATPFGIAGLAEPNPGLWLDAPVLAACVSFAVTIGAAGGALAVRRSVGPRRDAIARRPLAIRAREPVGSGIRFALDTGTDRRGAGLGTVAVVVAMLVAASGVAAMMSTIQTDASRSGGWWDGFIGVFDSSDAASLSVAIAADEDVAAFTVGGWQSEEILGGEQVGLMYVDPSGSLDVPMSAGRQPQRPNEVALGRSVMDRLDVEIGDVVEIPITDDAGTPIVQALDVVGETVFASPQWFTMAPGEGALIDRALVEQVQPDQVGRTITYLVRFGAGVDAAVALEELAASVELGASEGGPGENVGYFARSPRADVEAYTSLTGVPVVLAIELAVLVVATLLHLTLTAARRHRRDVAVLRSVGFTARQVIGAEVVQAITIAGVALLVGIPIGMLFASIAWRQIATQLVVLPRLDIDDGRVLAIVAVTLALASAVGLAVGRRAVRRPPACDLAEG